MSRFRTCLLLVFVSFAAACVAQQALTNDSIIKMAKAGLGDDLIVQSINSQPGSFQTTPADLTSTKLAPRMYQFTITPEMTIGEYGILPPGAVSTSNAASGGKMYTFTLLE